MPSKRHFKVISDTTMPDFVEGDLEVAFSSIWKWIKYDDQPFYRKRMQQLSGVLDGRQESTRALDLIATTGSLLLLVEVKDFRRHRIENKHRLKNQELALEVALKTRDTVAGMMGALQVTNEVNWEPFSAALTRRGKPNPIRIVLVLAQDLHNHGHTREEFDALSMALQQKMRWLTTEVLVCEPRDLARYVDGLQVTLKRKAAE